jgi:hypothetical protein
MSGELLGWLELAKAETIVMILLIPRTLRTLFPASGDREILFASMTLGIFAPLVYICPGRMIIDKRGN